MTSTRFSHLTLLIAVLLLSAACSPAALTPTTAPIAATNAPTVGAFPTVVTLSTVVTLPTEVPAAVESAAQRPAWQTLALTDARTGASFTLADFAGKTVYIEPMATWCTNCRAQQQIVREARTQLGDTDFVYLSLSVETTISGSTLAQYAQNENFGWTFAVATPELLGALVAQFGRTISNPPSTPHFIIAPDGTFSALASGQHSQSQLVEALTAARGA